MKKVIVTGGAGFIGSNLVDKLIDMGIEVVILDNLSTGKRENINPKAQLVVCNLANAKVDFLSKHCKDVDTIFHLASKTIVQESIENPQEYHTNNTDSTFNMLEAARINKISNFVFSSSAAIYGDGPIPTKETHEKKPLSPYALNKLVGEQYCNLYNELYKINTVCLRYFNVYGDRMNESGGYKSVISTFKTSLKNNQPLTINNSGNQRRDFIHVEDVVKANIMVVQTINQCSGEVYNVGYGENYTINQIAGMFDRPTIKGKDVIEPFNSLSDISKLKKIGWNPTGNLNEFLTKMGKQLWVESIGIKSNNIIYIHHHLGLGDHIVCCGLVKKLIKNFSEHIKFSDADGMNEDGMCDIVLAVKDHNYDTVKQLYSGEPVKFHRIRDDNGAKWVYTHNKYILDKELKVVQIGFSRLKEQSNSEDWEKSFYEQYKIDYKERWDSFSFKPNKERVNKLIKTLNLPDKFAFVNRTSSSEKYDFDLDTKLPVIELDKLTCSLLDWVDVLEKATEIHTIDSSIFQLIKQYRFNKRKVLYDIRLRDESRGYFTCEDDNWEIKTII